MRFCLPIRVGIDPMERLLVASFAGDPEFEAIEPQMFDDPVNGAGMRVLRYRKDGRVDVYWQPGVKVDPETFTVGAGLADFEETEIEPARFEIGERAVDLDISFCDAQGRTVTLRIHEDIQGRRGFPLLAPVGADIKKPRQFFLVYMPGIDMVRRSRAAFEAATGDRVQRPASLPILLDGRRVWFIRYAAQPIIGTLNPPAGTPALFEVPSPGDFEVEGMTVTVAGDGRVARIRAGERPRLVEMDFAPGFPNVNGIKAGEPVEGRWTIRLGGVEITGGAYGASRNGNSVSVFLRVTEAWKPAGLPLSMRVLTTVVRKFRAWPTTYRWRGIVAEGEAPRLSGGWERV